MLLAQLTSASAAPYGRRGATGRTHSLTDAPAASTSGRDVQPVTFRGQGRVVRVTVCRVAAGSDVKIDDEWASLAEGRVTVGRNGWQKHKKTAKNEAEHLFRVVQTLSQSTTQQLALVRPYLCDSVYDQLIIAVGIKRSNQARSRQEKLVAKLMQQEYSAAALQQITDMTEQMSMAKGRTGMSAVDELALQWRTALLDDEGEGRDDCAALQTEIVATAQAAGVDVAQLNTLLRRAREENSAANAAAGDKDATLAASAAAQAESVQESAVEAEYSREPTILTAEELERLMEDTQAIGGWSGGGAQAPVSNAEKRQRKRWRQALLKQLKPIAQHSCTVSAETANFESKAVAV